MWTTSARHNVRSLGLRLLLLDPPIQKIQCRITGVQYAVFPRSSQELTPNDIWRDNRKGMISCWDQEQNFKEKYANLPERRQNQNKSIDPVSEVEQNTKECQLSRTAPKRYLKPKIASPIVYF